MTSTVYHHSAAQSRGCDPSVLDANYPPQLTVGRRPPGGGGLGRGGGGEWGHESQWFQKLQKQHPYCSDKGAVLTRGSMVGSD